MRVPYFFRMVFNHIFFQKIFAYALLGFFLWFFQPFLVIFFITFLFSYLFLDFGRTLHARTVGYLEKHASKGWKKFLRKHLSLNTVVTLLYASFVVVLVAVVSAFVPKLVDEGSRLVERLPTIIEQVKGEINEIEKYSSVDFGLRRTVNGLFDEKNIQQFASDAFENVKHAGILLVQIGIALILSYVFILDRERIAQYLSGVRRSNFSFLYQEYSVIFSKIERGFGLVFKAQAIIAFVNAVLTAVGLLLISALVGPGGQAFPYLVTLSTIVFIMGFIPVLGTFLSSVPILIIAYTYAGAPAVVGVVAMVSFVHAVEAYYLNPKIVSSYTELPVFLTFLILLVSEHVFGFVGLLVGVPLFSIAMDILRDVDWYVGRARTARRDMEELQQETHLSLETDIRLSRSGKRNRDA